MVLPAAAAFAASAAAPEWQTSGSKFGFEGTKFGVPNSLGGLTLKLADGPVPVFYQWGIGANDSYYTFEEAYANRMHCVGRIGAGGHGKQDFSASWVRGSVKYAGCEVHVSRLTPAVLFETIEKTLGFSISPRPMENTGSLTQPDAFPKFFAFEDDLGETHAGVLAPGEQEFERVPDALNVRWMLFWYGPAYYTTGMPLAYMKRMFGHFARDHRGGFLPGWYSGDQPILFVPSQSVDAIEVAPNGIAVHFTGPAGRIAVVQPFENFVSLTDTAKWFNANDPMGSDALQEDAAERCRAWAKRLQSFPLDVEETWGVAENGDALIREKFTHLPLDPGAPPEQVWLPVPPMWAVAKEEGFPVDFGHELEDTGVYTLCGPYRGFYGKGEYEARVSGIAKYWRETRRTLPAAAAATEALRPVADRLERELDSVVAAGRLAPWIFTPDKKATLPRWENPGETLFYLSECLDLLSGEKRSALIEYLRAEDDDYPPEAMLVHASRGARREWGMSEFYDDEEWDLLTEKSFFVENGMTPIQNLYYLSDLAVKAPGALARPIAERWPDLREIPEPYLKRLDWASGSFFWPGGKDVTIGRMAFEGGGASCGVIDQNFMFAGAVGLARLADIAGDRETRDFAVYLLARAALTRVAMATFVRNLYRNRAQVFDEDVAGKANPGTTHHQFAALEKIRFYHWMRQEHDVRQIVNMDQFATVLDGSLILDHVRSIIPFAGMVPELGRLLNDYAKAPSVEFIRAVERMPQWHMAWIDDLWGREQGYEFPECSQQIFMAKAWIEGASADTLAGLLDVPWVRLGDLYYIQKLAETLRAWRGVEWAEAY